MEKDYKLSIESPEFHDMRDSFDAILQHTITAMERKGTDGATISLKLGIQTEEVTVNTDDGLKNLKVPKFTYEVNTALQYKAKLNGEGGGYSAVFKDRNGEWRLQEIDDGQMDFFDEDDDE